MRTSIFAVAAAIVTCLLAPTTFAATADDEAKYTETITKRADDIVAKLNITDPAKADRVRDILVQQYRDLRKIHDARDEQIAGLKKSAADKAAVDESVKVARDQAQVKLDKLNEEFVAKLAVDLTPYQVETVKNAMTYNVLNVTYDAYCDKLPQLTDEQKSYIKTQLTEAREKAMTGGSSEEKHAWFGKYKGRINNYLSQQGYDLKQAEKEWQARLKERRATQPSN